MTSPPNPLIAERVDTTTWYSGFGLIESIDQLVDGVESGSWVDGVLGGFGTVAEGALWVMDPVGALITAGFGMLVEHVKPLSDALDWLAGDPDQITANANTWANVAKEQAEAAEQFRMGLTFDIGGWTGPASEVYRQQAAETHELITALSRASAGMSLIVSASGALVSLVRTLVRDLIAECITLIIWRAPTWTAEEVFSLGIATPYVAAQVTALVAKWSAKIARLLKALIRSIENLIPVLRRLDEIIETISSLLKRRPRLHVTQRPDGSFDIFSGSGGGWKVIDETPGGAVGQLDETSCVSAAGEMLTGRPQVEILDAIGAPANSEMLASYLGDGWRGGFLTNDLEPRQVVDILNDVGRPWAAELYEGGKMGHMVVVDGMTPDGLVKIRDPYGGGTTYKMTLDEFLKFWTGNAVFKP